MKAISGYIRTYFAAFAGISLPFIILLILSSLIQVNMAVIVYGLTFSVITSFAIAHNFRHYETLVTFTNPNLFANNLINYLGELGYLVKDKTSGTIELEPTVYSYLFAGNIVVHLADQSATIEGARLPVRKCQKELMKT